jgi:hypothetical protein
MMGSEEIVKITSPFGSKRRRTSLEKSPDWEGEIWPMPTYDTNQFDNIIDPNVRKSSQAVEEWAVGTQFAVDMPDSPFEVDLEPSHSQTRELQTQIEGNIHWMDGDYLLIDLQDPQLLMDLSDPNLLIDLWAPDESMLQDSECSSQRDRENEASLDLLSSSEENTAICYGMVCILVQPPPFIVNLL